ncbi:MAG: glucose-1-phosphate cytidylyltransferase [bacterium]|nr:glucose-1-phosphate cytidylyltransferase [bacterium]
MPVVILAGGLGMRLREETEFKPKPMVLIGNKPILWHIMKIYSYYGFNDFIICLGYKGEVIKEYFLFYKALNSDINIDLKTGSHYFYNSDTEAWNVTLVDTGLESMTGARVKKVEKYINTPYFMLTYGDGVADIDIRKLLKFHISNGKIATVTGVKPPSRFGELRVKKNLVTEFNEKPQASEGLINGGFFVFNRAFFKYLDNSESCTLEREPLQRLAADKQLACYIHTGFWYCMDTIRDVKALNQLWESGKAPWKIWK